jgi:hypothetical protein
MPVLLTHAIARWAEIYNGSAPLRTFVAFVHVAGLVGGGGAAVVADRATLIATRRGSAVRQEQLEAILQTHRIVVLGLAAVIVSGVPLFAADLETYAASRVFWIKMAMVAALMINGAALTQLGRRTQLADERLRRSLRWAAVISVTLWFLTTLAGTALPNI